MIWEKLWWHRSNVLLDHAPLPDRCQSMNVVLSKSWYSSLTNRVQSWYSYRHDGQLSEPYEIHAEKSPTRIWIISQIVSGACKPTYELKQLEERDKYCWYVAMFVRRPVQTIFVAISNQHTALEALIEAVSHYTNQNCSKSMLLVAIPITRAWASPFLVISTSVCLSWMDRQLTVNHFRLLFCVFSVMR